MDLLARGGVLKPMLIEFALSDRFHRELTSVLDKQFPDGVVDDSLASMAIDHFVLQHELPGGGTVVDRFVMNHTELSEADRDLLLSWKDVVEGVFEVRGKEEDSVILFNLIDELTYRTRSNMGKAAFEPMETGMFLIARLVPIGPDWMISGNIATYPADQRGVILTQAAEFSMRNPEAVFRNPAKLDAARRVQEEQRQVFLELYGEDLIVVSGSELNDKVDAFYNAVAAKARPGAEVYPHATIDFPPEVLAADTVAIHFDPDTGLNFYVEFGLMAEIFAEPALVVRQRYRETLTGYLRDEAIPPAAIRLLAEPDPQKAGAVFQKLLNKRAFSWDKNGEDLLRKHKAKYFDNPPLPRYVPLSETLSEHLH